MDQKWIDFELEEPSGLRREHWPVTRGVPFPQGSLPSCDHLRLLDPQGAELPLQVRPLGAAWPDGSIRWALLHFQADLAPQTRPLFRLEYGPTVERAPVRSGVSLTLAQGRGTIDTGALHATFSCDRGFALFEQVWLHGRAMLAQPALPGFVLVDGQGQSFSSAYGQVRAVEIEEAGPLRGVVHLVGDHRTPAGERLFGYEVRIYAYAGLPWLELEYTFVNDADPLFTDLQRIGFVLRAPLSAAEARGLCGYYRDMNESAAPFTLFGDKGSSVGAFPGLRIYDSEGRHVELPHPGEMSYKTAHGWLDMSDEQGGVTVAVRRAVELHPKGFAYKGDEMQVDLWPGRAETLHWHQGMARTHRILLFFHEGSGRRAEVNKLCTCYEEDLNLWAPGWYAESGVLGPIFSCQPERYPYIEAALRDLYTLWRGSDRATGLQDYGDCPQLGGKWESYGYMANNQLDLAHALAMQYARVGEEPYFWDLEAVAWHLMDIDTVHHTTFDPVELGGARIQGNGHVQYDCEGYVNVSVCTSQMWTEGLLEYYYLSGHPRALQIALGIGDCFVHLLERGWGVIPYPLLWHGSRDSGWPLVTFCALYEATRDEKWMTHARRVVENLLATQGEDGGWDMWLGWYRSPAPLHLGITMTALMRYHQITGEESARQALIRAADALLSKCRYRDGALMYVNKVGYRWNYYSGVAFEALGYAWQLTGDMRYLRAGWLAHRRCLERGGRTALNGSTLAADWRGNLRYMYWADQAGLLTDLDV